MVQFRVKITKDCQGFRTFTGQGLRINIRLPKSNKPKGHKNGCDVWNKEQEIDQ